MLTPLDYLAIAGYVIALLAIGYRASRRETAEGFLIAERKMGTFGAVCTINATKTGSIILIYTALMYEYGVSGLWYFVGVVLGYLVFIPFAKRLYAYSDKQYFTLADYFFDRYGKLSGYAASIVSIILMGGFLITNLIASSKVVAFHTGWSFEFSTISVAVLILVYLCMAGFRAVVHTDTFQYIAIVFLLVVFLLPLSRNIQIPASDWNVMKAGMGNIFGFFLFGILIPFASPDLWQRVYAMPTVTRMKRSIVYSVAIYLPTCIVLTFIGLLVKAHLPDIDPDLALMQGFATLLPVGLSGLALVVFFAAFMSSIDTYAYTAASSIVKDFRKDLTSVQMVFSIRIVIALLLVFAVVVAIYVQDLLQAAFIFASFFPVLALPSIVTFFKPSVSSRAIGIGMVAAIVSTILAIAISVVAGGFVPETALKVMGVSMAAFVVGSVFGGVSRRWR